MKIFLIGLPGCGKSTLGRQLANQLSSVFFDLDHEIESQVGLTVQQIFKQYGESFFRKQESETLRSLTETHTTFILATGGGAPVFHDNMKFMNSNGITIFLDVPVQEIVNRISKSSKNDRPLLASLSPTELSDKVELLRTQRMEFYDQAKIKLQGVVQLNDLVASLGS